MKEIHDVLNNALVLIFNLVLKSEEKFIRNLGVNLSIAEIHTIDAIAKVEKKTMSEVASNLSITLGTLTASINNLEKKGYVERNRSQVDRRVVLVNITQRGEDVVEQHRAFHKEMIKDIVANLNTREELALVKALDNLIDYFMSKK
ncbi:MarR family transcriptional regulator [Alkalibaculum sp. M08DMB]|uniref:HTH-type transcriptional regulator SarZ n=1 Tax=Alkalibaculum sporogenes TaxID=2655001 RepID=A0A6A7K5H0_9FIRM|nr:MarR family transcriptional regulator [Alkalibaculum sporogenes]MPW24601.1 MarR family transcriptional regulator [Alkalibaculum sporogenes]